MCGFFVLFKISELYDVTFNITKSIVVIVF